MFDHILANLALHITLTQKEQTHITSLLKTMSVKKNQVLLRAGDVCKNIYFVDQGCLRMYYADVDGFQHNISFLPENWWAVDIASFHLQRPAFYSIAALEASALLYLPHSTLEQLYIDIPKLERFFRILTQNGFNLYQRRITSALSKSAEQRYLSFRKLYPGLETRISQKHIAAYIGITPVFLSQLRKRI